MEDIIIGLYAQKAEAEQELISEKLITEKSLKHFDKIAFLEETILAFETRISFLELGTRDEFNSNLIINEKKVKDSYRISLLTNLIDDIRVFGYQDMIPMVLGLLGVLILDLTEFPPSNLKIVLWYFLFLVGISLLLLLSVYFSKVKYNKRIDIIKCSQVNVSLLMSNINSFYVTIKKDKDIILQKEFYSYKLAEKNFNYYI